MRSDLVRRSPKSPAAYGSLVAGEHHLAVFLVAGGDAAKMLDLVEEPLDQIALLVDVFVVRQGSRSGRERWDYGLCPSLCNAGAKTIGVEALVGQQMIEGQAGDQVLGLEGIVHLARSQNETNGIAERIHARADLRAQAAARTPDRLIFAPPFAPAACWCARTIVESMIRYSKSGFSINALKNQMCLPCCSTLTGSEKAKVEPWLTTDSTESFRRASQ